MTDREWDALVCLIREWWPEPERFDRGAAAAYRVALEVYPPDALVVGLQLLLRRGSADRPSVAEIVQAIERDPGAPTWPEAYRLVLSALSAARDERQALARAERMHPWVGLFIRAQGYERLRRLPLDDPDWGHVERRALGEEWQRFTEQVKDRTAAGMSLAALERPDRHALERLDPLSALPAAVRRHAGALSAGDSDEGEERR